MKQEPSKVLAFKSLDIDGTGMLRRDGRRAEGGCQCGHVEDWLRTASRPVRLCVEHGEFELETELFKD